jgi:flagellar biosynthesis protein FlhG
MTKTIVITSGKGGVGKTNISVNVALELARRQQRTCLLDADLGLANVNILLGITPEMTLDDFLFRDVQLEEIIVETEFGIDVIPGSSGVEQMANLDSAQLSQMVQGFSLLDAYDYLIIDTSSGISKGVISFCLAASETLIVLTGEATSLADGYGVLKVLALNGYRGTVKILINKCSSIQHAKKIYLHFKSVADKHLKISIAPGGAVLADRQVEQAVSRQTPVTALFPESMASQCIRSIVSNLLVKAESGTDVPETVQDFWSRYHDCIRSNLVLPSGRKHNADLPDGKLKKSKSLDRLPVRSMPAGPAGVAAKQQDMTSLRDGLLTSTSLPTPLSLLSSALDQQSRGQLSFAGLKNIILSDPALICRVLQLSCSAQSGTAPGQQDIEQTIDEIGMESLVYILSSTAVHGLLTGDFVHRYTGVNALWAHSYKCGLLAEALARTLHYHNPREAFFAGMLHDVGRLALYGRLPGMFSNCTSPSGHGQDVLDIEKRYIGKTHAELGADMLRGWNVCSPFVYTAMYHAEAEENIATAMTIPRLVNLAHRLCDVSGEEVASVAGLTESLLGLSSSKIISCVERAGRHLAQTADSFCIQITPEMVEENVAETLYGFRQQAADYIAMKEALPMSKPGQRIADMVRQIHHGMSLLFGMTRVICLLPDSKKQNLQAVGPTHCFGAEFLKSITFSLDFQKSGVVTSYLTGSLRLLLEEDLHSMADRQLLQIFESGILVCIPLVESGQSRGVIVCGADVLEYSSIQKSQKRFEQFGVHAATAISSL